MQNEENKPANDPAQEENSPSAYIQTLLLIRLLRSKSVKVILKRLGFYREVLLFRKQLTEVEHALRTDPVALGMFATLVNQGIVFSVMPSDPIQNLDSYCRWQTVVCEDEGSPDAWLFAALWKSLNIAERVFLVKVSRGNFPALLTDDPVCRNIARPMGIACS